MSQRIRVLEVAKSLNLGGSEVLLSERMCVADHEVFDYRVAYLEHSHPGLPQSIESIGIDVEFLGSRGRLDARWLVKLKKYVVKERIQIIHSHSPLLASFLRPWIRTLGMGRPRLVTTEHNVSYRRLTEILDRSTIGMEDHVIAVSPAVAETKICRQAKSISTIIHGVDIEKLSSVRQARASLSAELGLNPKRRHVVCVAGFRPVKAHDGLVRAFQLLTKEHEDVDLLLVGSGETMEATRSLVNQLGLGDRVEFLGELPDAYRVTACGSVFVLASDFEGLPVAAMEALAVGSPCVLTAVGGNSEIVVDESEGFLVPPRDPIALATALDRILGDDSLQDRMSRAALKSSDKFDLRKASKKIEQIYRNLITE